MVGVSAEVSLYAGGRRLAENRRAGHLQAAARRQRELAMLSVIQEVRDAFLEYQQMQDRLNVAEKAVDSATQALESFDDLYKGDLLTDEEMPKYFENSLSTRFLLAAAQAKYYQVLFGYNLAVARLRLVTASDEVPTVDDVDANDVEELPAEVFLPAAPVRPVMRHDHRHRGPGRGPSEASCFFEPDDGRSQVAGRVGNAAHDRTAVAQGRLSN